MFVTQMQITNYLSVRGTIKMDLDRKVSVLLGSNDHGKSNLLTALRHLNPDEEITSEQVNWDSAEDSTVLEFTLALSDAESDELSQIVEGMNVDPDAVDVEETKPNEEVAQPEESVSSTEEVNPPPTPATSNGTVKPTKETYDLIDSFDGKFDTICLTRSPDSGLLLHGYTLASLPRLLSEFLESRLPRVELFKSVSGNLQDTVTADELTTQEFEFIQGVFFYADIDPMKAKNLFAQTDRNVRRLDQASEILDGNLRELWGQGTNLHFKLQHKHESIDFMVDDPAIQNRVARMSTRSDGVTQFFRVAMVLNARRNKNPANSYIYLFDEPGVYLHPQGQMDLIRVFERLADDTQIVYATHSLFMLNRNFPERHRLIYKDDEGTKIDQKPYRANWKLATDALGVFLSSNILFSSRVLLVEGDSDPMYMYELFRQLNKVNEIDGDSNSLAVMSFGDTKNLRFLLQQFRTGNAQRAVTLLVDGDEMGTNMLKAVKELCKRVGVESIEWSKNNSIEDLCIEGTFLEAVEQTLMDAAEAMGKKMPMNATEKINTSWGEFSKEKPKTRNCWKVVQGSVP